MIINYIFVEFIFYSFLGWIWESIYCTIVEKKWADRGFLFGPICPIYGFCVTAVTLLSMIFPIISSPYFPLWALFVFCAFVSAITEYSTSWFLEKRFNARWWDYSNIPLNIHGRICLPVTVCFGIAGVLVVKFLIPFVTSFRIIFPPVLYEISALFLAALLGADLALTEVSLHKLLKDVQRAHEEFNEKSQAAYEKISGIPKELKEKVHERIENLEAIIPKEKLNLNLNEYNFIHKSILGSITKLTPLL
ncbi:MAG: putative ABC transporter permease [Lachnospiraceae bacterium]|nr:putative ABC transporter permease [Lachnospiraceae bacterium]